MAKTIVRMSKLEALVRGSGLSQFQIAGITNIHPTTLGKLIKGSQAFNTKQILALSNFFEISPEEVVGYVDVEVDIPNNVNVKDESNKKDITSNS